MILAPIVFNNGHHWHIPVVFVVSIICFHIIIIIILYQVAGQFFLPGPGLYIILILYVFLVVFEVSILTQRR